ncbi:UvrD-helicase domain-containing protein [Solidesulfovibrio alcoholivorans]|uniref:UvrD-helicase domain-containing protein n=1 Tax=Solidesulfovibrio alcoholivorans TaxID=81406 RepID=UPI000B07A5A3|nr:UvrD-helicase domain-containing protein [Solidesulfovibrio alcoholivorans]
MNNDRACISGDLLVSVVNFNPVLIRDLISLLSAEHVNFGSGVIKDIVKKNVVDLEVFVVFCMDSGSKFSKSFSLESLNSNKLKIRCSNQFIEKLQSAEWRNRRVVELQEEQKEQIAKEEFEKKLAAEEQEKKEQAEKELLHLKNDCIEKIKLMFDSNFLNADHFYDTNCRSLVSSEEYLAEKNAFTRQWLVSNIYAGQDVKNTPSFEQLTAIGSIHGNIQVIARAGSGKTTTLVNRAIFLIKHCKVSPDNILILAFNRKAVVSIQKKILAAFSEDAIKKISDSEKIINKKNNPKDVLNKIENCVIEIAELSNIDLPHVMTFHALGRAIVEPDSDVIYDDEDADVLNLSEVIQSVIDDHIRDQRYHPLIKQIMLHFFKDDWESIVQFGYDKDKREFLEFRRSLRHISLKGDKVKSYGEKVIADYLCENGFHYCYEYRHRFGKETCRPDFTIFYNAGNRGKKGLIIEYFGMRGDQDYDNNIVKKQMLFNSRTDWDFLEIYPDLLSSKNKDGFLQRLEKSLEEFGCIPNPLKEEELWNLIKKRAIDDYTKVIKDFIGRCRKLALSPEDLMDMINSFYSAPPIEKKFLMMAHMLYGRYLAKLKEIGQYDYDGIMLSATEILNKGEFVFTRKSRKCDIKQLRYLCIDEFQDFSCLFYNIVRSLRTINPNIHSFCVGDSWQAINGFAGSDLIYYENFPDYFENSNCISITTNFRSPKSIVDIGNALMKGFGSPAVSNKPSKGVVLLAKIDKLEPTLIENQRHGFTDSFDAYTASMLRIIGSEVCHDRKVAILSRTRFVYNKDISLENYLVNIRSFFPNKKRKLINISTVHKYKGLQEDTIILSDFFCSRFPLLHPRWVFFRLFGDSREKNIIDEQRLLYVALSRAAEKLILMTESGSESPFFDKLKSNAYHISEVNWSDYKPVKTVDPKLQRVVVSVGNANYCERAVECATYSVKEMLGACGYRFNTVKTVWEKSILKSSFRLDTVKVEPWVFTEKPLMVIVEDEEKNLIYQFRVLNGTCYDLV